MHDSCAPEKFRDAALPSRRAHGEREERMERESAANLAHGKSRLIAGLARADGGENKVEERSRRDTTDRCFFLNFPYIY